MALSPIAQSLVREASRTWNNGSQQPTVVTYSFATKGGGFDSHSSSGFFVMPEAMQTSARMALDAWASVSGLHFVEVPDVVNGTAIDLRLRLTYTSGSYEASSPSSGGDISLAESYGRLPTMPGSEGYEALLLTVGYALGMNSLDSGRFAESTMAGYSPSNPRSAGLKAADVEAIQYTYGTQQAEDALGVRWSWDAGRNGVLHLGNDGAQAMTGTMMRDIMFGYSGNDTIAAGNGNDLINAGDGSNTVAAGAGLDTLQTDAFRFQTTLLNLRHVTEEGGRTEFGVARDPSHDSLSGQLYRDGESTTFTGIETIAFADGRLVFDATDPMAQVMRLYQAALGRQPDSIGREDWSAKLAAGTPLSKLAEGFLGSAEFQARFGTPDDTGFIARAYEQALGRAPDTEGTAFWQAKLAGGMTRAEMLAGFSESTENQGLTAGLLAKGLWDVDDQMADIARLYQAVLGRAPDQQGLRFWDNLADGGMSTQQMGNLFASSDEFNSRFPGASNLDFVRMVYQNTLGRPGEAAGEAFWTDHMAAGMSRGEVVANFAESTEFLLLSVPLTDNGIVFA